MWVSPFARPHSPKSHQSAGRMGIFAKIPIQGSTIFVRQVSGNLSASERGSVLTTTANTKAQIFAIDLLRAASALLVMLGHERNLLFVDGGQVLHSNPAISALYFMTGFGHSAVVIFFVLSGYLVGGPAGSAIGQGKFSIRDYYMNRLVRLWVVLLPALALGAAFDHVGIAAGGVTGRYGGQSGSNLVAGVPDLSLLTAIGNALFLQTILVPTFGSNSALWSLANEFWYYALFPLLATPFIKRSMKSAVGCTLALLLTALLGTKIVSGGIIWLFGALAWRLRRHEMEPRIRNAACLVATLLCLAWLFAIRTNAVPIDSHNVTDLILGVLVAVMMVFLPAEAGPPHVKSKVWRSLRHGATLLSTFSYSMYLVHLPLLFLLVELTFPGRRLQPDLPGCLAFLALAVFCTLFSYGFFWLTERQTTKVRTWLRATASARTRSQPAGAASDDRAA